MNDTPQRFDRCLLIDPTMRCDNEDAAKCCQGTADLKCPCRCHRTEKDYEIEQLEGELSRLRALNAELVAMVERCAGECGNCGGDGRKFVAFNHGEREYDPCDDCADLRTLLERAKGEV